MPLFYFNLGLAFLFSILLPLNNLSIFSIIGFSFALIFIVWLAFCFFSFLRTMKNEKFFILRKTCEYTPYILVIAFILSRISVSNNLKLLDGILLWLWFAFIVLNAVLLYKLSDKRLSKYFPSVAETLTKKKRSIFSEIMSWIDAIVQAACLVLLFTVFVFQLYVIPSESMVPEFMIGDRVAGFKLASGPGFPLSSYRLPQFHQYKRGDVVIIRHPHYANDPHNDLKFFASQYIQYITFTAININRDADGNIKFDPLVKRITGIEGEKVMLVDGVLYIKKAGKSDFEPFDESGYAVWNLSTLPNSQLKYVKDIKMDTVNLNRLESVETLRRELDFDEALEKAEKLVLSMKKIKGKPDKVFSATNFLDKADYLSGNMARNNEMIALKILTTDGGLTWFESFLKDWYPEVLKKSDSYNLYERQNAKLNVLIKLAFAELFIRNAELYKKNISEEEFAKDSLRNELINQLEDYLFYLLCSPQRNMNEFPQGENYIPKDCYFMMGDNRFNSTDMRHGYKRHLESLCTDDPYSVIFITNVEPKYVHSSKMLGTVNFIIYPFSRFGKLK